MRLCCSESERQVQNSSEIFSSMLVGRGAVNSRVRKSECHQYLTSTSANPGSYFMICFLIYLFVLLLKRLIAKSDADPSAFRSGIVRYVGLAIVPQLPPSSRLVFLSAKQDVFFLFFFHLESQVKSRILHSYRRY